MNSKYNHYKLTLEHVSNPKGDNLNKSVTVTFDNHDDIFMIIEKLQQRNLFDDDSQPAEFSIGLKMFSEVMLRNKDNPIFDELRPAFKDFMVKLKTGI